jgi:indole-3-glycerol phosphate synthase
MADLGGTYLERIIGWHRSRAAADTRDLRVLRGAAMRQAADPERGARSFRGALAHGSALAVIAEVKRRSPSKGDLAAHLDPAVLAAAYASGGAAALSVLTDEPHFGGSAEDLAAARAATTLPVLRKDFTVCEADVYDAALMGADCVLLIAAALSDHELEHFHTCVYQVGLEALVEVHDEAELDRAIGIGAEIIGVNQRDLRTFQVDQDRAVSLCPLMGPGVIRVAESGVRGPEDAAALRAAGFHAVLVGESLVTSPNPSAAVAALRGGT